MLPEGIFSTMPILTQNYEKGNFPLIISGKKSLFDTNVYNT
jgi:hypothetical protein